MEVKGFKVGGFGFQISGPQALRPSDAGSLLLRLQSGQACGP